MQNTPYLRSYIYMWLIKEEELSLLFSSLSQVALDLNFMNISKLNTDENLEKSN